MDATATFEHERRRLTGIAYRMLGSMSDADDVVQDAWLRWSRVDHTNVDNGAAYLTTITSRLALDRLKSAQRRREQYVGPWLPEPVATSTATDPESTALMHESIMLGFLAVLERLRPVERAVFVLRDVFDLDYDQVGTIVDRSAENCRQIARRAREHVRTERPRVTPDPVRDERLLEAFVWAVVADDPAELQNLLHADVVLISDGGATVRAARHPVVGAERVHRFLTGVTRGATDREVALELVTVNGQVALYVTLGLSEPTLFTLEPDATGDKISRIFAVRNPDKLTRLPILDP